MAAGITYTPIATTTLSSAATDVTFSSISGSYTDLVLIFEGTATADLDICLQFNGDTGSNYSATSIRGDGSTVVSERNSNVSKGITIGIITGTRTMARAFIMNYSNATTYKSVISRVDSTNATYGLMARVGLWRNTAAITSVRFHLDSANAIASGSTFSLYGITAA